ncbi:MAG: mevalonate kinase family protein [Myxococcota bacterium]
MRESVASAPGKLMLAGEYAVAAGRGPALAVAVDRRVIVTLEDDGRPGWRVTSREVGLGEASPEEVPVVAAAIARAGAEGQGGHLRIESDLGSGPDKPGFGASAAITVATLGALYARDGRGAPTLADVVAAHREAQGGLGSGYDVATALLGGVCVHHPAGDGHAERVPWPAELHGAVLFTGRGSSTPDRLRRLGRARELDGPAVDAALRACGDAAVDVVSAWRVGRVDGILAAVRDAQEALAALDDLADVGVDEGGHGPLRRAVEGAGAVARTSGAGGGDCLWALAADRRTLGAAVAAAEREGFRRIDVRWPEDGLRVRTGGEA